MSNLGRYQDITTQAKQAGGVDALLGLIKDAAVSDAAPRQRVQGSVVTIVVGGLLYVGYRSYGRYTEKQAALRDAADDAEAKLRAIYDGADAAGGMDPGTPPASPR